MLLSNQNNDIHVFFTRGRQKNIGVYSEFQSYFQLSKNTIGNDSTIFNLFKQTLSDIILLFHDIAGSDVNLQERRQLCRKAWEIECDFLQLERIAKKERVDTLLEDVIKTTYTESTHETKTFD